MNKCRQCGAKVSDTEAICPVCGLINPIKRKTAKTIDITTTFSIDDSDSKTYKPKRKRNVALLFALLGWSGIGFHYLGYHRDGILWSIFNMILIGGLSTLGVVIRVIDWWPSFIFVTAGFYLVNLVFGLTYLFAHDRKDASGQFIE